jgi:hypothetical protein
MKCEECDTRVPTRTRACPECGHIIDLSAPLLSVMDPLPIAIERAASARPPAPKGKGRTLPSAVKLAENPPATKRVTFLEWNVSKDTTPQTKRAQAAHTKSRTLDAASAARTPTSSHRPSSNVLPVGKSQRFSNVEIIRPLLLGKSTSMQNGIRISDLERASIELKRVPSVGMARPKNLPNANFYRYELCGVRRASMVLVDIAQSTPFWLNGPRDETSVSIARLQALQSFCKSLGLLCANLRTTVGITRLNQPGR